MFTALAHAKCKMYYLLIVEIADDLLILLRSLEVESRGSIDIVVPIEE